MFDAILMVCDGNICRSPTAAAMLRARKPGKRVESAGLVALEGHGVDETIRAVAQDHGVVFDGEHRGRKLTAALCQDADLILVMEHRQRQRIIERYPEASGKTFLLTHWSGGQDIPDPYRRGREVFERLFPIMDRAVAAWAEKIQ